METIHTFGIDLLIRKCKHNKKQGFIYARITVDEERAEISTKEKIDVAAWDPDREIVKGKTIEVKEINQHLDDIRHKIRSKYRMLKENESLITAEKVKEAYEGILSCQKGHTLAELMAYYKKIWETKMKKGGFKNYKTTIDYLTKFLESKYPSKDVYLAQLNMEFATEFEHYVRTCPLKEYDPSLGNGVGKHIQRFKRILNWGADAKDGIGWMKTNPCGKYSCPLKKNKRKKLTFELLVKLEQKSFQDATLNYVKELFLFSCYTGFAFADVMALRESHFEWDGDDTIWCRIYRAKSDILSPIPLLKDAAKIINRHRNDEGLGYGDSIFKRLTNQFVNRCLKVIQEACEFDIPLTFHVARHTFAKTVALKNGIPLETVQLMMGHTKITTTQIYAEVDEEKIISDMSGIEEKLAAKRGSVIDRLSNPVSLSA
ncbi:site-specific integrase [Paracnuella aquatica]|uniref:site-specific integrase n=1 Tax=Paracnuella aquatica TaxID=2268757 RepID=UPI000DEEE05D|nr:site-specific integrase [Paracnuella aquatica]RPD44007.1 site-specific integrase [Paracnuella aquatica]